VVKNNFSRFFLLVLLVAKTSSAESHIDLSNLSPAELSKIKVTTISKREESAAEASSSIYVLTHEDIRRAGVTTIPGMLRLIPGIHVASIDSNRWALGVRGFTNQFGNKLLVLIDGRTVYTPFFSGVYWDTQNLIFEDIDRIEVIRGSGGTLYGANAVNGVINIITKHSKYTTDSLVKVGAGSEVKKLVSYRSGGKLEDNGYYRLFVGHFERNGTKTPAGQELNDSWEMNFAGFRVDYEEESRKKSFTIIGNSYYGIKNYSLIFPEIGSSSAGIRSGVEDLVGANLIGKMTYRGDDNSVNTFKAFIDYTSRENVSLEQDIITLDLEFDKLKNVTKSHELGWGVGFRYVSFDIVPTLYMSGAKGKSDHKSFNTFIQDKIKLNGKNYVTIGSKLEISDYSGTELQPNIRYVWLPNSENTVWAAISHAVRTPSKMDREFTIIDEYNDMYIPDRKFKSERLTSYELGYRTQPSSYLALDTSVFINNYKNLKSYEKGEVVDGKQQYYTHNYSYGQLKGVDFTANYEVNSSWALQVGYSYLDTELKAKSGEIIADRYISPKHHFKISSKLDLSNNIELDVMLTRYSRFSTVPAYTNYDVRLGWKPRNGIEVALVAKNIFNKSRIEFPAGLYSRESANRRNVFLIAKVSF
jgi:iron complex outermembrane recepter protein